MTVSLSDLCKHYEQNFPGYYGYYINPNVICFIVKDLEYVHETKDETYINFKEEVCLIVKRRFVNPERIVKKQKTK